MRFSFDEFVLDGAARELRRSDAAIHLSPKAFDLLLALVERRPAAISKADLHTLLWPDTFVTDTSLATLIGEVRNALDDDARRPRYIRTVHAFGYAFCGQAVASEHFLGNLEKFLMKSRRPQARHAAHWQGLEGFTCGGKR